jgi:peptidyl-prolyl cis-trans isomerase C
MSFRVTSQSFKPVAAVIASVLLLACLTGCRKGAEEKAATAKPLARIGSSVISTEEFSRELERKARQFPGRYDGEGGKRQLLEEMIQFESLWQKAQAEGLDRNPEMEQRFRRMVVGRYEELHAPAEEKTPWPKPEEAEAHYQEHAAEFSRSERLRVALIRQGISSKATPEKQQEAVQRWATLRDRALAEAAAQPTFGKLAQEVSEDTATRYSGGDQGWITREQAAARWPAELAGAVFALKQPGDVSPVIRTKDGLHLVKLIGREASVTTPFEQVRDRIAWKLRGERLRLAREEFYKRQKDGLNISVDEEALKSVTPPATEAAMNARPPSTPSH